MTPQSLPATLDAGRWIDQQREAHGVLQVACMPRLTGLLPDDAGEARVSLRFCRDGSGRAVVTGEISVRLHLECQRCLQIFDWSRVLPVSVALVDDEAAAEALPEQLDPLLVGDGIVRLHALIEDEIILGLPVVAFHENDTHCRPAETKAGAVGDDRQPNPFAVLEGLRKGKD